MGRDLRRLCACALALLAGAPAAASAAGPPPGSPEYVQRDNQNMVDAYGRQTGYQSRPEFHRALVAEHGEVWHQQLAQQLATPNRIALTPGNVFPGWNGGNPLRRGWSGRRGLRVPVSYTNRYGALIRGSVFAPLPGARDPYTGAKLEGPFPGIVITTGSVQGSERMYHWLAEDLAERGYVVLTYDVQGQGTSETLPHQNAQVNALPFCNPFAPPLDGEAFGCPGVPAQQDANFITGTQDALSFFLSTPDKPYANPNGGDVPVNAFNPLWERFDRSPDTRTRTPGRTTRVAIVGHSLGASAVSYVQGVDDRVAAVVALDKLNGGGDAEFPGRTDVKPVVPALAVQSEYGFQVQPYWMQGGSSIAPRPMPPDEAPDPQREVKTGFAAWKRAGVDAMLVVPRASTHLEYTDIAYVLPASRYGQALTSVYTQAWLDRYLKHEGEPAPAKRRASRAKRRSTSRAKRRSRSRAKRRAAARRRRATRKRRAPAPYADPLRATSFRYLEPVDVGRWDAVTLERDRLLSYGFCSAYAFRDPRTRRMVTSNDIAGVGGC
jgi:dienelactone hydrolase